MVRLCQMFTSGLASMLDNIPKCKEDNETGGENPFPGQFSSLYIKDCTFFVGIYSCIALLLAQPHTHAGSHALRDRVWLRMGGLSLPCRWTRFIPPDENTHAMKAHQQRQHLAAALSVFDLSCCVRVRHNRHAERDRSTASSVSIFVFHSFWRGTTLWCGTAAPLIEIKLKEYKTAKTVI